ncbi:MAG: PilT/PilU family type 4a pilus ATPase [Luteitalea sp.]|nr:PilT/PilU family type 4a pilus ATPase [Luteitalea sp.]
MHGDRSKNDLDDLVDELDAFGAVTPAARPGSGKVEQWLRALTARRGSDLLLVAGEPPSVRVCGKVVRLDDSTLDGQDIEDAVLAAISPHAQRQFRATQIADASLGIPHVGRFRVNLHRERGRSAAAIRALPTHVPSIASLNLPKGIDRLTRLSHGLVLIGGATGSGKTTTLAALIDDINRREARHIITIEDPIEYEHTNVLSIIEQVEVGLDAPDFPTALRAALRQAPDIIVVGEMRDAETMRIALAAGETGHLVFSTLHTTDIATTISRIADSFPSERQPTIRQELAMAVTAVFTQTLLPTINGERVPAAELLMVSYGARQHIRKNGLQHLHQEITITRKNGSFSLEDSLARLVKEGVVHKDEALLRANHPEDFQQALATMP